MGQTQHFGLQKFGSEGRISDEGHKFSNRDRDTLDSLLYQLYNHDHRLTGSTVLDGPLNPPTATVSTTGGTLAPGTAYWYKISYVDTSGNETVAAPAAIAITDTVLASPPVMALSTADTGGTLAPGTYKYALSYYQNSGGQTTAPNIASISVPTGTSTNTVTITLDSLPAGATGWKIYRKAPGEVYYYLLDTITSGPTYVDDGTQSPDCNKTRPTANSTNTTNSITIAINSNDLPLDNRVASWRIYRSPNGEFGERSLIATQTETTTEGGSDLVTTYTDTGDVAQVGLPLGQSTVPPAIPQLDAGDIFDESGKRLPSALAPLGTHTWSSFLAGTVADSTTYNQIVPPHDMPVERVDVFFQTGPTGVSGSDYVTIRVKDDSLVDEVQEVYTDAAPINEVQNLSNNATGGTFTISFDGQGPTNALDYDAPVLAIKEVQTLYNNATGGNFTISLGGDGPSGNIPYNDNGSTIETELEGFASITAVTVTGAGTAGNPWVITFDDPVGPLAELTTNDAGLTGGTSTVATTTQGRYGIETELEKLSNITDVSVSGGGIASDPWVIEFVDPGGQDVAEITTNDGSLTGGTSTITTAIQGSDGGTFTLSDGTDTTSAIAYDALASTVETRLETDITSITDVTVTGTGTEGDPWVITFVNPGDQDVDQLIGDGTNLSEGASITVSTSTEGRGNTIIDVDCQTATQHFSWQSSTTDSGEQEAEESPATGGSVVSDTLATNDSAAELDAQNEENYWNVGTLDPGDYVARFYVSDYDKTSSFDCEVVDDHLGTPTQMAAISRTPARSVYTPAYEVKFTSTGTEDIFFVTTKTDTGTDRVRVDKYEYEVELPTLYAGQNVTVEVAITGTPTTNGDDVQVNVWY